MMEMPFMAAYCPGMPSANALERLLGGAFCVQIEASFEAMTEASCPRAVTLHAVRMGGMLLAAELLGHLSSEWRQRFDEAVTRACRTRLHALNSAPMDEVMSAARRVH